jgi:hypothetical protein
LSYTWYPVINILKQSTETNEKARPSKASAWLHPLTSCYWLGPSHENWFWAGYI